MMDLTLFIIRLCCIILIKADVIEILNSEDQMYANRATILEFSQKYWKAHNLTSKSFQIVSSKLKTANKVKYSARTLNILLSTEHNLVAMNSLHFISGRIPVINDPKQTYLVRLSDEFWYQNAHVVIEYSKANIENIVTSGHYSNEFISRLVYVPSLPFQFDPNRSKLRKIDIMTCVKLLSGDGHDRRKITLSALRENINNQKNKVIKENSSILMENVSFRNLTEFQALLDSAKVILNVHQTDFHHTFEEFRVLPALLRGVVVVSEEVPLAHTFPLHEYVIFTPYHNLVEKTLEVLEKYEFYREKFFGPLSKFNETIIKLKVDSYNQFESVITEKRNQLITGTPKSKSVHSSPVIPLKTKPTKLLKTGMATKNH